MVVKGWSFPKFQNMGWVTFIATMPCIVLLTIFDNCLCILLHFREKKVSCLPSDRKILFEMFLNFSSSHFQCFFKYDLYLIQICIFWFVGNWLKIWSLGDVSCISWFQSWPTSWVTFIAILPWNALLTLSVSMELISLSARVTSVKSAKPLSVS